MNSFVSFIHALSAPILALGIAFIVAGFISYERSGENDQFIFLGKTLMARAIVIAGGVLAILLLLR